MSSYGYFNASNLCKDCESHIRTYLVFNIVFNDHMPKNFVESCPFCREILFNSLAYEKIKCNVDEKIRCKFDEKI